ncbi:MAG: two-component system regulatory protein YycI [Planifilum fimeticola]|jgi:regulatory protein YycI of two-component signal transduction system YycFG
MDWSRAKTLLIIAFVALNLFLTVQVIQAWVEKSQMQNENDSIRRELTQILREKDIETPDIPQNPPPVSVLEARIAPPGKGWEPLPDGGYGKSFHPPVTLSGPNQLDAFLEKQVPSFKEYHLVSRKGQKRIYLQYWKERPLYGSRLEVKLSGGRALHSLKLVRLSIKEGKDVQTPVPASFALFNLVESGKVPKGTVFTHIELGYHGQSYDAKTRVLSPVWKFAAADGRTYYVNALTGALQP